MNQPDSAAKELAAQHRWSRRGARAGLVLVPLLMALVTWQSRDVFRRVQGLYQAPKVVTATEFKRVAISGSFQQFYNDNRFRRLEIASTPVANSLITVSRPKTKKQYVRFLIVGNVLLPATSPSNDQPLPVHGMLKRSSAVASKAETIRKTFGADVNVVPFMFATDRTPSPVSAALSLTPPLLFLVCGLGAMLACWKRLRDAARFTKTLSEQQLSMNQRIHELAQTSSGQTVTASGLVVVRTADGASGLDVDRAVWVYADGPQDARKVRVHTELGEVVSFPVENSVREAEVVGYITTRNPLTHVGLDPFMDRMWTSYRSSLLSSFREVGSRSAGSLSSADVLAGVAQGGGPVETRTDAVSHNSSTRLVKQVISISLATTALLVPLAILPASQANPIKRVRIFPTMWLARDKALVSFVEKSRGRPFKHPVRIDLLSESDYDRISGNRRETERYTCSFDARCATDGESVDVRREVFELLGLRPGGNGEDLRRSGAYYSQIEKRIYVRGKTLTRYLRSVIVHELTHAWQDQHFDLNRLDDGITTDDAWLAWGALVEGDASYVMEQYRQSQPNAGEDTEADSSSGDRPSSFQFLDLFGAEFPYAAGPSYVKQLRQSGGLKALDRRFKVLPNSVREILDGKHRKSIPKLSLLTNEGETIIYGEYLDVFRYYVLLADQQAVDFEELAANWRGGAVQLVSFQGNRCARLILGVDPDAADDDPKPPLPSLLTDPTTGLTRVRADDIVSVSNCLPIPASAKRTGDLRAVDQLLDTWTAMIPYAVDSSTTRSADRIRAQADLADKNSVSALLGDE
jgi:hypothetical protein